MTEPIRLDLCVIGAMKAATTSLAAALAAHPDVCMADPKEPMFFSHDEVFAKGASWYLAQFARPDAAKLGEASTSYSRRTQCPLAAARLHGAAPGCRLVYVLRDPARRAYSHYQHRARRGWDGVSPLPAFWEFVERHPWVLDASEYDKEIAHIEALFGEGAVFCLRYESLIGNDRAALEAMCAHVGVDPAGLPAIGHQNERGDSIRDRAARAEVDAVLHRGLTGAAAGVARRVLPQALRSRGRDALRRVLKRSGGAQGSAARFDETISPYDDELRARLRERFEPTIAAIERRTGWDLSDWRAGAGRAAGGSRTGDAA